MFFLDTEEALDIAPAPLPNSGLLHPRRPGVKPIGPVRDSTVTSPYDSTVLFDGFDSAFGSQVSQPSSSTVLIQNSIVDGSMCAVFPGSTLAYYDLGRDLYLSSGAMWAITFRAKRTGPPGNGMLIGDKDSFNTFIWLQQGTRIRVRDDAGFDMDFSVTNFSEMKTYSIVSDGTDDLYLYINGEQHSVVNRTTAWSIKLRHIGHAYIGAFAFNGPVEFIFVKHGRVSASDIRRLHTDPYQFLRPKLDVLPLQSRNVPGGYALPAEFEQPRSMIPGVKPTWPVEVDWTHPLSKGLKAITLVNNNAIDLISNSLWINTGVVFSGDYGEFDANEADVLSTGVSYSSPQNTILIVVEPSSMLGIENWASTSATDTAPNLKISNFNGELRVESRGLAVSSGVFAIVGQRHAIAASVDLDADKLYMCLDGIQIINTASSTNGPRAAAVPQIGNSANGFEGKLYFACFWSRCLTPAELQRITRNPYQFLKIKGT